MPREALMQAQIEYIDRRRLQAHPHLVRHCPMFELRASDAAPVNARGDTVRTYILVSSGRIVGGPTRYPEDLTARMRRA